MTYAIGPALTELAKLPDGFAQTCVTSPPYWGLRDYGHDGQLGLETTPEEYLAKLVAIFAEVRRVLRDDGTLWVNLGDSYCADVRKRRAHMGTGKNSAHDVWFNRAAPGLKPKDLVGIPWRVAFALQADGWYLRSDIIWSKPNPMPESVTDRPTKAHEYVFLLSRSPRYFYDADAVREGATCAGDTAERKQAGMKEHIADPARFRTRPHGRTCGYPERRNRRTVWTVATQPYSGAHFACFPPKLIEPCIMAGCPEGGMVLDPFLGSGTVGEVCEALGRQWFGIELNPEYEPLIQERTKQMGLFGRS